PLKPEPRDKPPAEVTKPITPKPAQPRSDAERLAAELIEAKPAQQERLLEELRDNKGPTHTQALLAAIPQLRGDVKKKARDALAQRMARMTSATLKERLSDDDAEMRRAAAL